MNLILEASHFKHNLTKDDLRVPFSFSINLFLPINLIIQMDLDSERGSDGFWWDPVQFESLKIP